MTEDPFPAAEIGFQQQRPDLAPAERDRICANQALAATLSSWNPSLRLKRLAAIAEIGLCRRIRSDNGQRSPGEAIKFRTMKHPAAIRTSRASGLYHGWLVVAAAFLIALFGFGLGSLIIRTTTPPEQPCFKSHTTSSRVPASRCIASTRPP